jgi:hypothetical protein
VTVICCSYEPTWGSWDGSTVILQTVVSAVVAAGTMASGGIGIEVVGVVGAVA